MRIFIASEELTGVGYLQLSKENDLLCSSDIEASYSVDMTLPRTNSNDRLLGIIGVNYQDTQPCADGIECAVTSPIINRTGTLYVNAIRETSVDVTLFLIPSEFRMLMRDVLLNSTLGDIIVPLDNPIDTGLTLQSEGTMRYTFGGSPDWNARRPNPYVKTETLRKKIEEVTGLFTSTNFDNYAVVPTSYYVSPKRKWQWLATRLQAYINVGIIEHGGAHVTTDYKGGTLPNRVTFNRTVFVKIHAWAGRVAVGTGYEIKVYTLSGGTPTLRLTVGDASGNTDYDHQVVNLQLNEGDALYYRISSGIDTVGSVVIGLEYDYYTTTEEDWDSVEIINDLTTPTVGLGMYMPVVGTETAHYSEFSVAANIGKVTVGQYLKGLAAAFRSWVDAKGLLYKFSLISVPNGLNIVAVKTVGDKEWRPVSDKLGQVTRLDWGGETQTLLLESPRLDEFVDVWKENPWWICGAIVGSNDFAYIPNISANLNTVKMERRLALCAPPTEGGWLNHFQRPVLSSLRYFDKCVELSAVTLDTRVTYEPFIYIADQPYMVTAWDYDEESGEIEFKALLIKNVNFPYHQ